MDERLYCAAGGGLAMFPALPVTGLPIGVLPSIGSSHWTVFVEPLTT